MKLKRIEDYNDNFVLEYRTAGSKNKKKLGPNTETVVPGEPLKNGEVLASVGKEVVKLDNYDDFVNKPAEDNPSDGAYDVDVPTANSKNFLKNRTEWTRDYKNLWAKIVGKRNFFVQGEAGWGKSAIIKEMALKKGYTVITVFMDKALPEDLDGIPVTKDNGSKTRQVKVMPVWAQYIADHPETQFLLFFDELNQAPNDVMNAMMPIAHKDRVICGKKFKNYFCGAAGNLDSENELNPIRRPVMARFGNKPIRWITGLSDNPKEAEAAWKNAFIHLHENWDKLFDKKLINEFETLCLKYTPPLFAAPRDLENDCIEQLYNYKNSDIDDDDYDRFDLETISDIIISVTNTEEGVMYDSDKANKFTTDMKKDIDKLATKCYNYISRGAKKENGRSFDEEDEEKAEKSAELNKNEAPESDEFDGKDTIDSLINMIAYAGEVVGHDNEGNPFTFPVTPDTIWDLFENLDKTTMGVIESELKKRNLTWVYPDDKAAKDSGKFDKFYED